LAEIRTAKNSKQIADTTAANMSIQSLAAFTICSNNYVPYAKVLIESLRKHHSEATLYLCLADQRLAELDELYPKGCYLVTADELHIRDFRSFAFRYNIMEFNTALKPFMIRHLLGLGHDAVLYLDPDIEVFAHLGGVIAPIQEGASFVLTPHVCQPSEGTAFPDDIDIMRGGVYNLGFLGVGAGPQTDQVLRWWSRRLKYQCVIDPDHGIFVDQKFFDLVPGFVDNVHIVRDTAYNVAYWNLAQRELENDGDKWLIDRRPLRFFHFSGINPKDLSRLSKHTTDFQADQITGPLRALIERYAAQVLASGYGTIPPGLYAYGRFASGVPIPDIVRQTFRDQHLIWVGDPFETYEEYLHLPAAGQWHDCSNYLITNIMSHLHACVPGLSGAFNPAREGSAEAYTKWFIGDTSNLLPDARLIEPVAERVAHYRAIDHGARRSPAKRVRNEPDVCVVSYLRLALGIGEAGRQTLRTLVRAGFNARGLPIALNSNSPVVDSSLEGLLDGTAPARFQVFSIYADQLPQVVSHLGEKIRPDAYRIMVPFWELADLPDAWIGAFDLVDEVWAPTRFVQTTLLRKIAKPVLRMPLLLEFAPPPPAPRAKFGLPEDRFLFFFAFDFYSFERKNPAGVVRAFRRAFRGRNGANFKVGLVLKTLNSEIFPERHAWLYKELDKDPDVTIIDRTLNREEILQLIACCDAVASLHRSEALGLLVAEAMALAKPVIATDYSATTELVTPKTGYPVDYRLVPVQAGQYPFYEGQVWAEPDIDHAAWFMRRIFEDQEAAIKRAHAARRHLASKYGLDACAQRMRERLQCLDGI
jgi:glycosyltransferase involved in cell wall biosynthesis